MAATYPPPDVPADPEPPDIEPAELPRVQVPRIPAPTGAIKRTFDRIPPWVPAVAVGGLALTSCIYVAIVDPNTQSSSFYPACTFKQLTGLDCPGCGLTRAMHSLMTG